MFQETDNIEEREEKIRNIEKCAKLLLSASVNDIYCEDCENVNVDGNISPCEECKVLRDRVKGNNTHKCGFSCHKKKKQITIKAKEGHGRLDGISEGKEFQCLICRYNFPKMPMRETTFIPAISKTIDEESLNKLRKDYKKIRKYISRQTYTEGKIEDCESWKSFKKMTYEEFLYNAGMMPEGNSHSREEKVEIAHKRYLEALAVGLKGNGAVFVKRSCADVFTNNFNTGIMKLHDANHDIQLVSDPFACCEYVTDYITKAEEGMSQVLKTINEECKDLSKMGLLNKLAQGIDKKREVSIQEAVY